MLSHGNVPRSMLLSSITPIPKNQRKSLNESDNYRGISLSSVIGKVLDWVVIHTCSGALQTTDHQFDFKPGHSTTQCTFVVDEEVVQYYLNGGSRVYAILLDASQAFDRVHFIKMFKLLLDRGLCPLVCRLLVKLYTQQSARLKWGGAISDEFKVSNGVKQGGVLSPILFGVYMDELFKCLRSSQAGCHVGQRFMCAFGYADDVILLAPTKHSMHTMLDKCMLFFGISGEIKSAGK